MLPVYKHRPSHTENKQAAGYRDYWEGDLLERKGTRRPASLAPTVFLFLILQLLAFFSTADGQHGPHGPPIVTPIVYFRCTPELLNVIRSAPLHFKMSSPTCTQPWPLNIVFMFEQSPKDKSILSYILVAIDFGGYIAVGSSPDGGMIGSSAIAGWISSSGKGVVKSYYLGGRNSTAVVLDPRDRGGLQLVPGSASIVSISRLLLLGFQLNISGKPSPYVIFAVGPPKHLTGPDFVLPMHYARTSSVFES